MQTTPFFPYAKQSIHPSDIAAVTAALEQGLITRGPPVQQFEQEMADYCDVPYAVALNSGTAALMAAYFAAELSPYDRVISTPNSFIATVGAPLQKNIHPHFIDIDRTTGNIDLDQLSENIDFKSTRGRLFIVPVHFSGIAQDMSKLNRLRYPHPDSIVIEDAAHAIGSRYPTGEKVGSCAYSEMTIFSFHPAKMITTGEGGMVTTRDAELFHRLQLFRDNGIERHAPYLQRHAASGYYEVQSVTGNYNFTSFQAALGLSQLKRIETFILKRRKLVNRYRQHLQSVPHFTLFTDEQDHLTAFHLFVVQIDFTAYHMTREIVMSLLKEKGIGTQVHYIPLYHHPIFKNEEESLHLKYPNMENYYQQALSLPLYYDLEESDVDRICEQLLSIFKD